MVGSPAIHYSSQYKWSSKERGSDMLILENAIPYDAVVGIEKTTAALASQYAATQSKQPKRLFPCNNSPTQPS
jgi:hypothetical protein